MSKMEQHLDATLEQILELARWAPSGDNTQPWRFEILDARRLIVHGHDTRDHCVYDLDGHPSQMSIGALLETMAIAASAHQLEMQATRHNEAPESRPTLTVEFTPAPAARFYGRNRGGLHPMMKMSVARLVKLLGPAMLAASL
ncbi:nitroreductase family protein, partial [Duganella vulcania]|uniref:nitroreductase family protein n=1 Tax=Duganella vulcania TaxID=2692166 RepID=UPI0020C428CE